MSNFTTPFPTRTGDTEEDIKRLYAWSMSLVDELKYMFCNLDGGNVTEAAKVEARNIDCSKARIKDAQLQSITADKLTAGTIDTGEITVKGSDDKLTLELSEASIIFREGNIIRIALGQSSDGQYVFTIQSRDKKNGVYMDDDGNVIFRGVVSGGRISSDTNIEVGYGADGAVKFMKPSGSIGAKIYYDDSQDAIIIDASNIILNGHIVNNE